MSERYQMGSPQWLAALHAFFVANRQLVQPERDLTVCYVYRDAPASIRGNSSNIAFTVRFRHDSPEVEFELTESAQADFKATIDYDTVLPISRLAVDGDSVRQQELQRLWADAVGAGEATIEGELPPLSGGFSVHDELARLTA